MFRYRKKARLACFYDFMNVDRNGFPCRVNFGKAKYTKRRHAKKEKLKRELELYSSNFKPGDNDDDDGSKPIFDIVCSQLGSQNDNFEFEERFSQESGFEEFAQYDGHQSCMYCCRKESGNIDIPAPSEDNKKEKINIDRYLPNDLFLQLNDESDVQSHGDQLDFFKSCFDDIIFYNTI